MTETPERDPLTEPDETAPAPPNPPDALTDPDVDEVRANDPQHGGETSNETDPYELRSMPAEPNGTEDDPGSYLNP